MAASQLWRKSTYISAIEYIVGNMIREFDISKANINVLRDANVLTEEQYQYYLHCDRMERQVAIGKLQGANPEVVNILKAGIENARKVFIVDNGIIDSDILYIRNDAIAIIGSKPISRLQVSEHVAFRESGRYSSFYRFGSISMLYLYDMITGVENIDIKGLGESRKLHEDFMIDFLTELFYRAQVEGIPSALSVLQNVHKNYIAMKLPINYYREFNSASNYRLLPVFSSYSTLYKIEATEYDKRYIDISYNDAMLRHFVKIFASIIF